MGTPFLNLKNNELHLFQTNYLAVYLNINADTRFYFTQIFFFKAGLRISFTKTEIMANYKDHERKSIGFKNGDIRVIGHFKYLVESKCENKSEKLAREL